MLLPLLVALTGALSSPPHGRAELLSQSLATPRSGTLSLALRIEVDPGWHVYWRNPGAAGLPPRIEWARPPRGLHLDSLLWPAPETIPVPPLMTYGYQDSVLFPLTAQAVGLDGDSLRLRGTAHWQVCKEICLLEKQDIALALPVRDSSTSRPGPTVSAPPPRLPGSPPRVAFPDPLQRERFERAWNALPRLLDPSSVRVAVGDSEVVILLQDVLLPPKGRVFPITPGFLDDAAEQRWQILPPGPFLSRAGMPTRSRIRIPRDPYLLSKPAPDTFAFVVRSDSTFSSFGAGSLGTAIEIHATTSPLDSADTASAPARADSGSASGIPALLLAMAFAVLGGLLLNLMPCVLPVLSLKVLDLLRTAGHDRRKAMHHGLAYAAGVVGSFLALATTLLILRSGGSALGWGFQLQSPPVVAILSGLMLLVACNLWGVFEPGASLANLAGTARPSGWAGSFLTGLTATVVATPCTAPFMGAALGYTLTRPAPETLLVFAFLGIGLAAPVVLITTVPSLGRLLPRPGVWMETLKQALGFAMAATAAWLGWLLARLSGTDALAPLFTLWLLVALGVWILGKWAVPHRSASVRWIARVLALALFAGAVAIALRTRPVAAISRASQGEELWHPGLTQELRASGKPWFLHFTADWCLSCQVNERNAFADDRVEEAFRAKGVRRVKADWTARDTGIARELERFGRQGIPFYVLSDGKAESVLPEVVTPGIVLKALDKIR